MTFFLYEIAARIVALCLCVVCGRGLRRGFNERKIELDPTDWFAALAFPTSVAHRDATPVRYWITVGLYVIGLVACVYVVIFGWSHPDT